MHIAVIGAGISGISAAKELTRLGHSVEIFEKSTGFGGRLATRRVNEASFDHGAQYFTVSSNPFRRQVDNWIEHGLVQLWNGRICQWQNSRFKNIPAKTERYVGMPSMTAPIKHMASELKVHLNSRVKSISLEETSWHLHFEDRASLQFDAAVISTPPEQARELIGSQHPNLSMKMESVVMQPTWALMLIFSEKIQLHFDGCFVNEGTISWLARNNSKPGRPQTHECWLIHATNDWSIRHIDEETNRVSELLTNEFIKITQSSAMPLHTSCHLWRYATPKPALQESHLFDPLLNIGICGDWCAGAKVEGAYLSGLSLAQAINSHGAV